MKRLDSCSVIVVLLAAAAGCKGDPTADLRTGVSSLALNTEITVTSTDPAIATVKPDSTVPSADGAHFNFIVTAIAPGQTKLVATASGVSDTASVTVR